MITKDTEISNTLPNHAEEAHRRKQQQRTIDKKKLFIDNYLLSLTNIKTSCRRTGISRWTYYEWRKNDSEFVCTLKVRMDEFIEKPNTIRQNPTKSANFRTEI